MTVTNGGSINSTVIIEFSASMESRSVHKILNTLECRPNSSTGYVCDGVGTVTLLRQCRDAFKHQTKYTVPGPVRTTALNQCLHSFIHRFIKYFQLSRAGWMLTACLIFIDSSMRHTITRPECRGLVLSTAAGCGFCL